MSYYGRSDDEWAALEDAGWDFLISHSRLRQTTSCAEMNEALGQRAGIRKFDFGLDSGRAAMGELLGRLSERSIVAAGVMISALIHIRFVRCALKGAGWFPRQRTWWFSVHQAHCWWTGRSVFLMPGGSALGWQRGTGFPATMAQGGCG